MAERLSLQHTERRMAKAYSTERKFKGTNELIATLQFSRFVREFGRSSRKPAPRFDDFSIEGGSIRLKAQARGSPSDGSVSAASNCESM